MVRGETGSPTGTGTRTLMARKNHFPARLDVRESVFSDVPSVEWRASPRK